MVRAWASATASSASAREVIGGKAPPTGAVPSNPRQDTCHVIRDHAENKEAFSGPRFLMRGAELEMHPLDSRERGGPNRASEARDEHGLGLCNITRCCTDVCPEHIQITDNALIPLKERAADRHYDPVLRFFRRKRD